MKKNILIVGATHGNEFTGAYLVKKWSKANIGERLYPELNISTMIANPKAFTDKVRFIEQDLNRSFSQKDLQDKDNISYEVKRARQIKQEIQERDIQVIFDLHTTTANMGINIILAKDNQFNLKMAAFIQKNLASEVPIRISYVPGKFATNSNDHNFLTALTDFGALIEVGPIANNIVRHDILEQTEQTLLMALDYIAITNSGKEPITSQKLDLFVHKEIINFPLDENGQIDAIIHKDFQDKDYIQLKKGQAIFINLRGEKITWQGEEGLYPVFINEAAYYQKNAACFLLEKQAVNVKV